MAIIEIKNGEIYSSLDYDLKRGEINRLTITDAGISVNGNIIVSGNVDGVDISGFKTNFDSHVADKDDPHEVTKTQVGLANVRNVAQYSQTEIGNFFDGTTAISGYNKSNWNTAYKERIDGVTVSSDSNRNVKVVLSRPDAGLADLSSNATVNMATLTRGDGLSGSNYDGSTNREWSVNARTGLAGSRGTITVHADGISTDLGETSTTAYRGDRGKDAYDDSLSGLSVTSTANRNVTVQTDRRNSTNFTESVTIDMATLSTGSSITGNSYDGSANREWDTVQDIRTTASPEFAGLTLTNFDGAVQADNGVISAGTLPVGKGGTGQTTFPAGNILFGNGSSALNTDSDLHWDNMNKRLGIGTTSLSDKLDVNGWIRASSGYRVGGTTVIDSTRNATFNSLAIDNTGHGFDSTGNLSANTGSFSSYIGSPNYQPELIDWRITKEGHGDFRYIYSDELRVKAFTADVTQALFGSDMVCKSGGELAESFDVPAENVSAEMIVYDLEGFKGFRNFEDGDYIRLRPVDLGDPSDPESGAVIGNAWGTVQFVEFLTDASGDLTGKQKWSFTTKHEGYAGTSGMTVQAGSWILDYGRSGDGIIERSAIGNQTPYDRIFTWYDKPWKTEKYVVQTHVGNLGKTSGYISEEYLEYEYNVEDDGGEIVDKGSTRAWFNNQYPETRFGAYFRDQVLIELGDSNEMIIGKNAGGTSKHGIKINQYNYQYGTGEWRVGDDQHYLEHDGIGTLTARLDNFDLEAGLMTIKSDEGIRLDDNNYWFNTNDFRIGGEHGIDYDGTTIKIGSNVVVNASVSFNNVTDTDDIVFAGNDISRLTNNENYQSDTEVANSVNSAKDDLAIQFGFTNYDELVTNAITEEETIIAGGYINTSLIQASTAFLEDLLSVNANVTNQLTVGNMLFGVNVGDLDEDGIHINSNNYLYDSGEFKLGGGSLSGNATSASIDVDDFELVANNILINSTLNRAKFGNNTHYIDWNDGSLDITTDTFNLDSTGLKLNSTDPSMKMFGTFDNNQKEVLNISPTGTIPALHYYDQQTPANLNISGTESKTSTTRYAVQKEDATIYCEYDIDFSGVDWNNVEFIVVALQGIHYINGYALGRNLGATYYNKEEYQSINNLTGEYLTDNTLDFDEIELRVLINKTTSDAEMGTLTISNIILNQNNTTIGFTENGIFQRLSSTKVIPLGTTTGGAPISGVSTVHWDSVNEKPFSTVGNGLTTASDTLAVDLSASDIPNLDQSKITTGEFPYDRLPISSTQVSNWDIAHGWGDHSQAGYAQDSDLQAHIDTDNIHRVWENSITQNIHEGNITSISITQHEGAIDHDALSNYVASEHRIWENSITENIHSGNITEGSVTQHEGAINHNALTNYTSNQHRVWENNIAQNIHEGNITQLSVTQHEGAIDHDALTNYVAKEHLRWDLSLTGEVVHVLNMPNNIPYTLLTEYTISGVELGNNLSSLTDGTGINNFSYNGSGTASVSFDTTWGDNRYYEQSVADSTFLTRTGDSMLGTLNMNNNDIQNVNELDANKIETDEFITKTFISDTSLSLAGTQFLTKSNATLNESVTVTSGSNFQIKVEEHEGLSGFNVFEDGDWVLIRTKNRPSGTGLEIINIWGTVTFVSESDGIQTYDVTFEYSTVSGTIEVHAGTVVLDWGTSGDGVLIRSAVGIGTPFDEIITWFDKPYNPSNWVEQTRIGNLNKTSGFINPEYLEYEHNVEEDDGEIVDKSSTRAWFNTQYPHDSNIYGAYFKDQVLIELGDTDTMIIGKNAGGIGEHGFKINQYNYQYGTGKWRVGDSEHYLKHDGDGNVDINLDTFHLESTGIKLTDTEFSFGGGALSGNTTSASIDVDSFYLVADEYTGIRIDSENQLLLVGNTAVSDSNFNAGTGVFFDAGNVRFKIGSGTANFLKLEEGSISLRSNDVKVEAGGAGFGEADFYLDSQNTQMSLGGVFKADGFQDEGELAGWTFDPNELSGGNLILNSGGSITNTTQLHENNAYQFNNDGSGHLAGKKIEWTTTTVNLYPDEIEIDTGGGWKEADYYLKSSTGHLSLGDVFWVDGGQDEGVLAGFKFESGTYPGIYTHANAGSNRAGMSRGNAGDIIFFAGQDGAYNQPSDDTRFWVKSEGDFHFGGTGDITGELTIGSSSGFVFNPNAETISLGDDITVHTDTGLVDVTRIAATGGSIGRLNVESNRLWYQSLDITDTPIPGTFSGIAASDETEDDPSPFAHPAFFAGADSASSSDTTSAKIRLWADGDAFFAGDVSVGGHLHNLENSLSIKEDSYRFNARGMDIDSEALGVPSVNISYTNLDSTTYDILQDSPAIVTTPWLNEVSSIDGGRVMRFWAKLYIGASISITPDIRMVIQSRTGTDSWTDITQHNEDFIFALGVDASGSNQSWNLDDYTNINQYSNYIQWLGEDSGTGSRTVYLVVYLYDIEEDDQYRFRIERHHEQSSSDVCEIQENQARVYDRTTFIQSDGMYLVDADIIIREFSALEGGRLLTTTDDIVLS